MQLEGNKPGQSPTLKDLFGVTDSSHKAWHQSMLAEEGDFREATKAVLARELREQCLKLSTAVRKIIENCLRDPDDIREEIALPSILKRVVEVVREFSRLAALSNSTAMKEAKLHEAISIVSSANKSFLVLLERMELNDNQDFTIRAKIINSVLDTMIAPNRADTFTKASPNSINSPV